MHDPDGGQFSASTLPWVTFLRKRIYLPCSFGQQVYIF